MNGWRDFHYLITSAPHECPFDIGDSTILSRIEMCPRGQWLLMNDADALLIVMDDARGLKPTGSANLFEFTGSRPNLDQWMSAQHPDIGYIWLDQFVVAFADRAAQLSFDHDLGERLLWSARLPRLLSI
jgi:hypothetical protein